jgi:hypothetical protein
MSEDAARTINQIYEPTGRLMSILSYLRPGSWDNTIETGNSDLLNTYTAEQQVTTVALKQSSAQSTPIGYLTTCSTLNEKGNEYAGFMPLKRQFGFVFDGTNKTLAIRVGHGVFDHNIPKKEGRRRQSDLLMDYGPGQVPNHSDWGNHARTSNCSCN